jgi:hypothetical protein
MFFALIVILVAVEYGCSNITNEQNHEERRSCDVMGTALSVTEDSALALK